MSLTEESAVRLLELVRRGMSCNAIARELGVAASTVSRRARQAGLSFDRSATAVAVEASKVDAAQRREQIAGALLEDIARARLGRLAGAKDAREFQQVAQGLAALSRAFRDVQQTAGAPGGGEESAKDGLRQFFALTQVLAAQQRGGELTSGPVVVSENNGTGRS